MKRTAFALSFLCSIILLQNSSCINGNKYRKEAQMLDSLQILVIKCDSAVVKIDSAKITGYGNHVMNDMQLLQMNHIDSMSNPSAEIFRAFNQARWSLITTAGKRGPLVIELAKSQKQLSHLSHDLQHGLVPADSAQFFIATESKKAEELIQVSNMTVSTANNFVPQYLYLLPKADSLISLVQNHKKI